MAFNQNAFDVFQETIQEVEDLDVAIQRLATQIVTEMREQAPVDTGDLQRSIKLNLDRYKFIIEMLDYGSFQNYGVGGSTSSPTNLKPVEFGVEPRPSSEPFYAFESRRFGLQSQQFFNVETIESRLTEIIEEQITA